MTDPQPTPEQIERAERYFIAASPSSETAIIDTAARLVAAEVTRAVEPLKARILELEAERGETD